MIMLKKTIISLVVTVAILGAGYYWWEKNAKKQVVPEVQAPISTEFNENTLIAKALRLASKDYKKPGDILSKELKELDYDKYRDIRFARENAPWHGEKLPFEVQFFHLGSIFQISVPINEVVNGQAKPIKYSPKFFNYGKNNLQSINNENLGYAGFRLHNRLNSPTYYDELVSFLGASYFRALAKGQKYGLSARGLAIDTAVDTGEEFPIFKEFWIERPARAQKSVKVYALLDSPSVAGAYTFVITPGKTTTMDVEAVLYPRKKINKLGVAPLTSMFLFGENTKNRFDDHRPEVHDSDGLLLTNGSGETIWRPLDNSRYLRISSFLDNNPKGFGLMQRDKNPEHYLDFEANYELRPSVWVEPKGDWGKGMVQLVEIPSIQEIHDNIVAYWIPEMPVEEKKEYRFNYRLYWGKNTPLQTNLAKVLATHTGVGGVSGTMENHKRKFVIDFDALNPKMKKEIENGTITAEVTTSEGNILGQYLMYNPLTKGASVYIDFEPNNKTSELRVVLKKKDKNISEVWSYQWLP